MEGGSCILTGNPDPSGMQLLLPTRLLRGNVSTLEEEQNPQEGFGIYQKARKNSFINGEI